MAGLDFKLAENVKLELGYRFLDYGKITSGGSNCINGMGAGSGFGSTSCNAARPNYVSSTSTLASNDFHVGLIWFLEPTAPAAAAGAAGAQVLRRSDFLSKRRRVGRRFCIGLADVCRPAFILSLSKERSAFLRGLDAGLPAARGTHPATDADEIKYLPRQRLRLLH